MIFRQATRCMAVNRVRAFLTKAPFDASRHCTPSPASKEKLNTREARKYSFSAQLLGQTAIV
jgi:hypothetical protein